MFFLLLISTLFAFVNGFTLLSPKELLILALIYLVSFTVDVLSGVLGAKYGGASLRSVGFGILGAVVGMLIIPPFGGIAGLFLGVLLSEYSAKGNHRHAFKASSYGVLGIVAGLFINVLLAIVFLAAFITMVFFTG